MTEQAILSEGLSSCSKIFSDHHALSDEERNVLVRKKDGDVGIRGRSLAWQMLDAIREAKYTIDGLTWIRPAHPRAHTFETGLWGSCPRP